jgi:lysyl-tRNA synthetase class 1
MAESHFWADQIAEEVVKRAAGRMATCRSGASPSGAKHIGNLFDVMKSYIVYKALVRKGAKARFVLTHDDRDPLRKIPDRLPTLDGKWVSTKGRLEKAISVYLGHPYVNIPDPFDCCKSWAEHFSKVWENGIYALGIVNMSVFSNDALYNDGKFDPYIKMLLENLTRAREIIAKFQKTRSEGYMPFDAICERCGKITARAVSFNLDEWIVDYECLGKELAGKYKIEGCGNRGTTSLRNGKLPWRFEWPAQWGIFENDFEPFGKEHAEGSWQSGQVIARELYKIKPPIPHIYEFLLVNGEKMSASRGNVYLTQEILDIIEPEIFFYFYTKRSKKQRDLELRNIHLLVDEFEHAERIYFGANEEANKNEKEKFLRMYETSMKELPKKMPVRIPYQLAAVIATASQVGGEPDSLEHALRLLRSTGHIKELSEDNKLRVMNRILLAKNWVERFAPEHKIIINDQVPQEIIDGLDESVKAALKDVVGILDKNISHQELEESLYNIAKKHSLASKDFFKSAYRVIMSEDSGPRLAHFIIALGPERIKNILEQL